MVEQKTNVTKVAAMCALTLRVRRQQVDASLCGEHLVDKHFEIVELVDGTRIARVGELNLPAVSIYLSLELQDYHS